MKTVLVTGYNGFIGSNLIPELQKKFRLIGVSKLKHSDINIKQIKHDISKNNMIRLPEKISTIIHLAGITGVDFCQSNPKKAFATNIQGTKQILELARKKDSNVIFLSTSHVFGKPKNNTIKEDYEKNPSSVYGITKLAGEILCKSYSNSYGLNIGIPRLFSIYGPHAPIHSVSYSIIQQILTKKNIRLGNIKSERDFLYVKDAINAILIIMKKNKKFNDYNVGAGKGYSIIEICDLVKKISKKDHVSIKTVRTKIRKNDFSSIISNSSKIKKLGWEPKISIKKGLRFTVDWHKHKI